MAPRTKVDAKSLETLGAPRLAVLLEEFCDGDAGAGRRLRIELAAKRDPRAAAKKIMKRLARIDADSDTVYSKGREKYEGKLDALRRRIMDLVAPREPGEAFEAMRGFADMAPSLFARCHYDDGRIHDIVYTCFANVGELAARSGQDPLALAEWAFGRLRDESDYYGAGLVERLAPALGEAGLLRLKELVEEFLRDPFADGEVEDEEEAEWIGRKALCAVACARGDIDGLLDVVAPADLAAPSAALDMARRCLDAGRPEAALRLLDMRRERDPERVYEDEDLGDVRAAALEALGRGEDARAARLAVFREAPSAARLRAWLGALPESGRPEAEEEAVRIALGHPSVDEALAFLLDWRAPGRAADLLVARRKEAREAARATLERAAGALSERYPLAATMALRALARQAAEEFDWRGRKRAVRLLADCAALAPRIEDFAGCPTHERFLAWIERRHRLRPD